MKARLKFSLLILGLLASGVVRAQSELSYDTNSTFLKWPEHIYMGEPAGVAHNSKGHIFIYTRTGSVNVSTGTSRTFTARRNQASLNLIRMAITYARSARTSTDLFGRRTSASIPRTTSGRSDSGSNMVIKFDPQGRIAMLFGRKPESVTVPIDASGIQAGAFPNCFWRTRPWSGRAGR